MEFKLRRRCLGKLVILDMELVFHPEPIGRLSYEFARELANRGHKIIVVAPFPPNSVISCKEKGLPSSKLVKWEKIDNFFVLRVFPRKSSGKTLVGKIIDHVLIPFSLTFWSLLAVRRADVVHCPSPPLFLALGACFVSALKRVPFVVRVHDLHPDALVKMNLVKNRLIIGALEIIEKIIYSFARRIAVIAETYKSFIISRGVSSHKVRVIPNWSQTSLNPGSLTSKSSITSEIESKGKFLITYGGSLYWAQDLETVIDAAYLLRDNKDIIFLIMGDGPEKQELVERARKLKLENVVFMPFEPREVYLQMTLASHACIVTLNKNYTSPTLPSKVQEIMGLGKPIIVNAPYNSEVVKLVKKASCGLIVEPGNPESFAKAVLKITKNQGLAEKLGKNGRIFAEKYFSPKICIGKYEKLLRESLLDDGTLS